MAQAKRLGLYMVTVFVLYAIIAWPVRSANLVQIGFEGLSDAAHGVGSMVADLVR
ncbi:hypothetical protein [Streptomyces sp. NPDC005438]|uniref:hypothetical protein n=1 Tax=Streptomyces sp. NPDC005438 TaxID=3156880 RepID=UPI0033A3BEF8